MPQMVNAYAGGGGESTDPDWRLDETSAFSFVRFRGAMTAVGLVAVIARAWPVGRLPGFQTMRVGNVRLHRSTSGLRFESHRAAAR